MYSGLKFGSTVKRSLYQFLNFQALVSSAWFKGIIKMRFHPWRRARAARQRPNAADCQPNITLFSPSTIFISPSYDFKPNTNK